METISLHTWTTTVPDPRKLNPVQKSLQIKQFGEGVSKQGGGAGKAIRKGLLQEAYVVPQQGSYWGLKDCIQLTQVDRNNGKSGLIFFCFSGLKKSSSRPMHQAGSLFWRR